MNFSKAIKKVARWDGNMVYRRVQTLPLRVKFREFKIAIRDDGGIERPHLLTISYNGEKIVETYFIDGEPISQVFDPPLAMARGTAEIKVVCTGFAPFEEIDADVTVDFALAVFG